MKSPKEQYCSHQPTEAEIEFIKERAKEISRGSKYKLEWIEAAWEMTEYARNHLK